VKTSGRVVGLLVLSTLPGLGGIGAARENSANKVALSLNAGESYVIEGLSRRAPVGIKVVANANALVVNADTPGKLLLLATEAGRWEIEGERADGRAVTYEVTVRSVAQPFSNPLAPGKISLKQKTAYEIGTGDWSSDLCSSDLRTIEIKP